MAAHTSLPKLLWKPQGYILAVIIGSAILLWGERMGKETDLDSDPCI